MAAVVVVVLDSRGLALLRRRVQGRLGSRGRVKRAVRVRFEMGGELPVLVGWVR